MKILLIDVSGIYWAHWHVTKNESASEAFERTVSKVASMRSDYDHVAVCCDSPPYWRRDILPEYKAHRETAPPEAFEQFRRTKERLAADGFLLWAANGFEADDVIAFAVEHALRDGHEVTIASSDKDLTQLVASDVRMISSTGVTYTPEQVKNKFGVGPGLMRDLLSLTGDTSDNVPGVPGVGPKTAASLLAEYGSLEDILAEAAKPVAESDADEGGSRITKPKLKASLIEHADAARLAYRVVGLRTDVPLRWEEIYEEREAKPIREANVNELDEETETPEAPTNDSQSQPEKPQLVKRLDKPQAKRAVNQALALHVATDWSLALEPRSSKGAWEVSAILFNSRLYQSFGSQEAIYAVIVRGRSLGLDATTALAVFHNIQGRIAMHADLIEALVLRSGKAEYFEMVESTARKAVYATKRIGNRHEQKMEFTIEDAFAAELVVKDPTGVDGYNGRDKNGEPTKSSNWSKYRATMLRHRCKTQLARAVYSDVVLGLYSPDELDANADVIEAEGHAA